MFLQFTDEDGDPFLLRENVIFKVDCLSYDDEDEAKTRISYLTDSETWTTIDVMEPYDTVKAILDGTYVAPKTEVPGAMSVTPIFNAESEVNQYKYHR